MDKISILGAGIGGLCTAIALQRMGFEVKVYESAPEIKPLGAGLVLAANAIKALKELDLDHKVIPQGKQLDRFIILDEEGKTITQTDTSKVREIYGIDNFTIHRADLHQILLEELKPESLMLGKTLQAIHQTDKSTTLAFADGTLVETEFLIAADGINSVVRQTLVPQSKKRYSGYTCWRGVVEQPLESVNYTHASETWGSKGRFGIVPLKDNRTYWFACVNAENNSQQMKDSGKKGLLQQFSTYHDPIAKILIETHNDNIIWADIYDIAPLKRHAFGNILLIGDAAHSTTPNMGQGACQAIEDAAFLQKFLKKEAHIPTAFSNFEKKRLERTTWVINNSYNIGRLAQLENPWLIKARNTLLRLAPQSSNLKRLKKIYEVDFKV